MKTTKKIALANKLACEIGFVHGGLKDRRSEINRSNLEKAVPFTRNTISEIIKEFKHLIRSKKLLNKDIDHPAAGVDMDGLPQGVRASSRMDSSGVAS